MIPFRFQRITRRQGGGDEAYFTYVGEADDAANKVSQRKRIGIRMRDLCLSLPYSAALQFSTDFPEMWQYRGPTPSGVAVRSPQAVSVIAGQFLRLIPKEERVQILSLPCYHRLIPFLNQRWYRGGKEEATRRILHTLRRPTTQPTKIALWFRIGITIAIVLLPVHGLTSRQWRPS